MPELTREQLDQFPNAYFVSYRTRTGYGSLELGWNGPIGRGDTRQVRDYVARLVGVPAEEVGLICIFNLDG